MRRSDFFPEVPDLLAARCVLRGKQAKPWTAALASLIVVPLRQGESVFELFIGPEASCRSERTARSTDCGGKSAPF